MVLKEQAVPSSQRARKMTIHINKYNTLQEIGLFFILRTKKGKCKRLERDIHFVISLTLK